MAINRDKILQEAQKLTEKRRFDKAIVELQKLVAEDPNDVRTLLKIGDLYLKLEQFADAIATYEHVGQFYSAQGFAVKAVAVYKQIREIIQKHAPHLEDRFGHVVPRLAELLMQLDLRSDALAYYDEMATRLQRLGRDRDAIDVFKKIVGLDLTNPISHLRLADAFVRVRDYDSAVEEYGTAGEILLRIGRRDDALRVVERLLQHRQDARFARIAAEIYIERAQPNDGMAALTKLQIAFKENPKDLETLELLAKSFELLGQPAKSIEVQKEAARIAREAGNQEVFDRLLGQLMQRAPNDDGVRQLVALSRGPASVLPPNAAPSTAPPPQMAAPQMSSQQRPLPQMAPPAQRAAAPIGQLDEVDDLDEVEDDELVGDDELELVEEDEEPVPLRASYPPEQESLRHALNRAEALRAAGDHAGAVAVLRAAIAQEPDVAEPRERLCDILIETGYQDAAVQEMLSFAERLVALGDNDGAARLLDEVLLLEPGCPPALGMLHQLGYAVPDAEAEHYDMGEPAFAPPSFVAPSLAQPAFREPAFHESASNEGYDPRAPLPSYDLEGMGADDVLSQQAPAVGGTLDDPFQTDQTGMGDYRQPSYADETYDGGALPSYPIEDEPPPVGDAHLDESALEEIEFFQAHGMFDEAEAMLGEQLGRMPNHPLLLERQRELAAARAMAEGGEEAPASAVREPSEIDRSFDIAHALDALDDLEPAVAAAAPAAAAPTAGGQVSVEAIFEQFKAGVAAQIAESDAATHYDLGFAYKEMGLVADAIGEFELASRDPTRECVCQSMIGMMHMERGNIEQAIDSFLRGLSASQKTPEQELALLYEIGNAYEFRNDPGQAVYYFQLSARIDPSHRDPRGSVSERISALERQADAKPGAKAAAAAAGPDEFDAAFEDLFDPKG